MTSAGKHNSDRRVDLDAAVWMILDGTATRTGTAFFESLVERLATSLDMTGAWITEWREDEYHLRTLALWMRGELVRGHEFRFPGSPCEVVIRNRDLLHIPERLLDIYGHDPDLQNSNLASYLGIPLIDAHGTILGHMAMIDERPMPRDESILRVFRLYASRATAEMSRLLAEEAVCRREAQLQRLLDNALDGIVEFDDRFGIHVLNRAASRILELNSETAAKLTLTQFLTSESQEKLTALLREIDGRDAASQSAWIRGGLEAVTFHGERFTAEATLSRYDTDRGHFHTLIFRNVNERVRAERTIQHLTEEAASLREELRAFRPCDEILGESPAVMQVLHDIKRVAPTGASVLIVGETGTGKELVARAIHRASSRAAQSLVCVNCAALPTALMESELFGHEKGAFTGATEARVGRFARAHHGTIFLDEIGELPLELQAKLLRVLQEGELEPVGSSRTQTVDVRVIAATNRNLEAEVRAGRFREDLWYRLNVFPLTIPPLRERGDDCLILADAFLAAGAQRLGLNGMTLSAEDRTRLTRYPWPGNVRELHNVIERALILSQRGEVCLEPLLPLGNNFPAGTATNFSGRSENDSPILTGEELRELERENLRRALEQSGWKISGPSGAAARLKLPASTVASRMKAFGLTRSENKSHEKS